MSISSFFEILTISSSDLFSTLIKLSKDETNLFFDSSDFELKEKPIISNFSLSKMRLISFLIHQILN